MKHCTYRSFPEGGVGAAGPCIDDEGTYPRAKARPARLGLRSDAGGNRRRPLVDPSVDHRVRER